MIPKPLSDIVEADLLAMIDSGVAENRHLEFKQQLPDASDQGKGRFLKAVTALANTAGGDLIYGFAAEEGIATSIKPLDVTSRDQVLLRLESLCATGVDPRLVGVHFHWVPLAAGGFVLVVRVPKSWNAPHRVGASNQFYARNAAGSFPMDVTELRHAFTVSGEITQRMRAFRAERLLALSSQQGPVVLQAGAVGVLHVLPLQAFSGSLQVDLDDRRSAVHQIHPLGSSGYDYRLNLDGRLAFRRDNEGRSFGYAQLFRNGIVEAASVHAEHRGAKFLASESYELDILRALNSYLPALRDLGVETPAYVFFSLLGVKGFRMGLSRHRFIDTDTYMADRDVLDFPEILITDWACDTGRLMRPLFDVVWNAFGLAKSFNYNDQGEWVGQR